jgi:phosphoglycolate phosphatase
MKFFAVLLDMDGTLLDTLGDIANSMNAVLKRSGFPPHPVERYRKYVGGGIGELTRKALPDGKKDEDLVNNLSAQMREEYSRHWGDTTRLYPGVDRMLDGLSSRGIRLSILSNKPDEFTKEMYRYFLGPWDFEIVMGASPGFPKKPDPAAALHIAGEMGLEPALFVFLGDSDNDMKTAVAAGMYPAGALWGFRDEDELRANGARVLLKRPEDILNIM